jgi:hypothetical protein
MHTIKRLLGLREIRLSKPLTLNDCRAGQLSRASYRYLGSVDSYLGSADSYLGSVASMLWMREEGLSKEGSAQKGFDVQVEISQGQLHRCDSDFEPTTIRITFLAE